MDWCSTDINGVKLDPHEAYGNMVSVLTVLQHG